MSDELLAGLHRLLDEALDLAPAERAAWIERLRAERPEDAREVERLLAAETGLDARGFLVSPAGGFAAPSLAGRRLGAWTLERPLGHGGMGTVWLARRSDGRFEGTAAVKLLNLSLLDRVGAERFRREGTLLARLSHPNIARLMDAGLSDDGQPFLVLEHVEGERIDRWCEERRLPPEERLRLFLDVLSAVAHAHANLIVHRDLKPSNILVTPAGQVKLLDFGIAKLLDAEEGDGAAVTLTDEAGRALTPEYAAPEQVTGGAVTTATDVYALGVLLYLLLAGRHPTAGDARTGAEHLQRVVEAEPPRLSDAAAEGRRYRGDLDKIAAKALRKDPAERYPTVAAFADDIARYLNREPVAARGESWAYRAHKFVRRHRAGVAAAAITVAALVGATTVSLVQLAEAQRQRDAALAESRRRTAMADVQGVLAGNARGPGGRNLTTRERVELAEQVLRRRYGAEPAVVVGVLSDLADPLFEVNDLEGHQQVLDRAMALARASKLYPQMARIACEQSVPLTFDDHLDSAGALLRQARADGVRAGGLPPAVEVRCLAAEGRWLIAGGQADSAVAVLRRASAMLPDPGAQLALSTRNDLASALRAAGRTREAAGYQEEILAELDSAGYAGTDAVPGMTAYLSAALAELGEFRRLDSVVHAAVRRDEAAYGAGFARPTFAIILAISALRQGHADSAAGWLEYAQRDTTEEARLLRPLWVPHAAAQVLVEQGRAAEAWRAIAELPTDAPGRRTTVALLRAQLRRAAGDREGGAAALDSFLVAEEAHVRPGRYLVYALIPAAEWALDDGRPAKADSLARLAVIAAAVDSLAHSRSAHVGRAELARARAAADLGNVEIAQRLAARAAVALTNGLGAQHHLTRAAKGLAARFPQRT